MRAGSIQTVAEAAAAFENLIRQAVAVDVDHGQRASVVLLLIT